MGKAVVGCAVACAAASCAVAALLVARRVKSRSKWNRLLGILRDFEEGCSTPLQRLRQLVDAMAVEMHAGLASEGGSKLKMLLTFVDTLPNGEGETLVIAVLRIEALYLAKEFKASLRELAWDI